MPIDANILEQLVNNDPGLIRVTLSHQYLNDNSIAPLLLALRYNSNLEYLDLSHNLLTNRSGCQLGKILLKNEKICYLDVSYNFISPEYRESIDRILWERKKLEALRSSQRSRTPLFWQSTSETEVTQPEQRDNANDPENTSNNTFSFPFKPK